MERQTLQQQVPVYHVCQECGGEGCEACADLCIVEGDLSPINTVIGIKVASPINTFVGIKVVSGICEFCGCFSQVLDELSSDATPGFVIRICPACYSDYAHGGCDLPERGANL